jgi:two-component system, LytTR family, response regulator
MNCLIVDDEPLAIDLIEDFTQRIPFVTVVSSCKNAIEAIQVLNNKKIDLIFLDIQMPDISGIQLVQSIEQKPMVIFTTAYSEFAVESYNLNAIDYLLKPFSFERFLKAVNKAYTQFSNKISEKKSAEIVNMNDETENKDEAGYIFVKSGYKTVRIKLSDILYIEGLKDYVKIYAGLKPILILQSLKFLEEKLPQKLFLRVHKSYIVALQKIDSIERNIIQIGEKRIPVGDSYRDEFQKAVDNMKL